ncbi:MAG: hypothetical protein ACJA08_000128 [Cyclobacteriaceae bacterium]
MTYNLYLNPVLYFSEKLIMQTSKPRVIKDFEKLDSVIQEQIKLAFPYGFLEELIHFDDREGKRVSALPFETDEKYYLVRMTRAEAKAIIADDDDFDDDGTLKESVKDDYETKYGELSHMADYIADDSEKDNDDEDDDAKASDDEEDDDY